MINSVHAIDVEFSSFYLIINNVSGELIHLFTSFLHFFASLFLFFCFSHSIISSSCPFHFFSFPNKFILLQ